MSGCTRDIWGHQGYLGAPGISGCTRDIWGHQGCLGAPGMSGCIRDVWVHQGCLGASGRGGHVGADVGAHGAHPGGGHCVISGHNVDIEDEGVHHIEVEGAHASSMF